MTGEVEPGIRGTVRRRELFGWAMFDFANQAYTLLIITVIYGDLFTRVIVGDAPDYRLGNGLWSVTLALSYLLVLLIAPLAGSLMDLTGSRKRFLYFSWILTILGSALLYTVEPGWIVWAMLLLVVSNVGYALGESFIASFLPDLGPPERIGWISGLGWALGYVGGLVATVFALGLLGEVSAENYPQIRWVGPLTAAFLLIAALPTFWFLQERRPRHTLSLRQTVPLALLQVRASVQHLPQQKDLLRLYLSVFLVMAGIYIVVAFTFLYGAQVIVWEESTRVAMFVVTQITAMLGALGFGWLQDRVGPVRVYRMTLVLWVLAVLGIYATPDLAAGLSHWLGREVEAQQVFLGLGVLAGLGLGSAQSAGRALVALLVPAQEAGRWFGFWGLVNYAAAITGLLSMGLLQWWLGLQQAILLCAVLFAGAWLATRGLQVPRLTRRTTV